MYIILQGVTFTYVLQQLQQSIVAAVCKTSGWT
jgi:hypothetical protein